MPELFTSDKQFKIALSQEAFKRAYDFFLPDRNRFIEMSKLYWGLGGHYPDNVRNEIIARGEQPTEIHLIDNKLDGLRSSIIANSFDTRFEPYDGKLNSLAYKIQDMWYADKEIGKWDYSLNECIRDGLIQFGIEYMDIDRNIGSGLGHILFRADNPMLYVFDPDWTTPFPEDMRRLWRTPYMTPARMREIYSNASDALLDEERRQKTVPAEYGDKEQGMVQKDLMLDRWGQKHQVIEEHYIKMEERWWEYNMRDGGIPFPETGEKNQSQKDINKKRQYAMMMGLKPEEIKFVPENKPVYYVFACCPTLTKDVILEDKKSIIQIGRLPFFPWGASRMGSQYRGIADLLKDIQYNIDKYIRLMQELLDRAARGGIAYDPKIFGGDKAREENAIREFNSPSPKIATAPGASDGGGMARFFYQLPTSQIPPDLFKFKNDMMELADRFSMNTPASEGRVEANKESGRLFSMKYEASVISRSIIDMSLKQHAYDKADGYWKQGKITYAGQERFFPSSDESVGFKINERSVRNGIPVILNDISKLPRQKVKITFSQKSLNMRTVQREQLFNLKQINPNSVLSNLIIDEMIVDTWDIDEEKKKKLDAVKKLEYIEAVTATISRIRQSQAATVQAEMMINQLLPQLMGAPSQGQLPGPGQPQGQEVAEEQFTPENMPELPGESMEAGTPMEKYKTNKMTELSQRQTV